MAFTLANWACTSESLNQGQEVITPFLGSSTLENAPNLFIYGSPTDTVAAIKADNYFLPQYASLCVGDWILGNGSDASFSVVVTSVSSTLVIVENTGTGSGLARLGVYSNTFTNAGGSATTVITDPSISSSNIVIARFASSANAVNILTVLPGAGILTIVSSADPGASVIDYIAYSPTASLQNAGVIIGDGSYAGGSATFVIANPLITAGMTVNANFQSEINAAAIYSVTPGAGILTFVCSANPGASVVEYVAFIPSSILTELGLYGANFSNAGGSATITITDANINASSIVTADFSAQANVSLIQKVTPSSGTLTILTSANPGVSIVDYMAVAPAIASGPYVPLAGGQLTGTLYANKGTATSTAAAATINTQAGVVTTEALTTAAASAYAFTLTNSQINASSVILLNLMGGTNTIRGLELRAIPGAGTAAISIYNNNVAGTALNGTLKFGFEVL